MRKGAPEAPQRCHRATCRLTGPHTTIDFGERIDWPLYILFTYLGTLWTGMRLGVVVRLLLRITHRG